MLYIGIACDHRLQPQVSDNIHHDMLATLDDGRGWTLACTIGVIVIEEEI